MLVVLNMKQQNVDMTCMLYNGIYSKNVSVFLGQRKNLFLVEVQRLTVYIPPLQMTEEMRITS